MPIEDFIPVKTIERSTNLRSRRQEIWAAESLDGMFRFQREEDGGTTWSVFLRIDGSEVRVSWCHGTLKSARRHVAFAMATYAVSPLLEIFELTK